MNASCHTGSRDADPRIAFFDGLAGGWDAEGPAAREMIRRLEEHRELLGLKAGMDLLEVGCGTGKTTGWLAARIAPGRLTAVDFAPAMIAQARAKGIDATFCCRDVCCDDLGSGRFDVVFCFHCFPHFRDQPAALLNFAEAMAQTGRLIVMHLAGSDHINEFHAGVDEPVRGDALPGGDVWPDLLSQAHLRSVRLIDREDLFFMEAAKAAT